MKKLIILLDVFMNGIGNFFSFALPIMAIVMSISLGSRMFFVPDWPARVFLFFMACVLLLIGLYLLIKRKKLNWT